MHASNFRVAFGPFVKTLGRVRPSGAHPFSWHRREEGSYRSGMTLLISPSFPDLFKTPEAASVQFVRGRDRAIVGRAVDKDQFPFAGGLENIVCDSLGSEIGDAQLFAHFASEGLFHTLTQVHMPAHGCIPFAWLDVFPYGTLLQIELALGVEYMQVDHGVQQFAPVVAFAPGGRAQDVALLVDHGKL